MYAYDKHTLRFELPAFLKFLKILAIGSSLSIALNSLAGRFPPLPPVDVSSLFFVGWEDVIFSLLLIFLAEKLLHKWIFVPVVVLSSLVFGAGHLYQGIFCAILLSFYPYFISYRLGKKFGYATVILAHVTYDLTITANGEICRYLAQLIRSF